MLRPRGRVALAVWAAIDESPGYAELGHLLADLFGEPAAESLRAPFALGDPAAIVALLRDAGFRDPSTSTERASATFPSMESWMFTESRGWTLAGSIDDAGFDGLVTEAHRRLARFERSDGTVQFDIAAVLATATV